MALDPLKITLPEIVDPDGDATQAAVFFPGLPLVYDPDTNEIRPEEGASVPPGEYTIFISVRDGPADLREGKLGFSRVTQVPYTFTVPGWPVQGSPQRIDTYE